MRPRDEAPVKTRHVEVLHGTEGSVGHRRLEVDTVLRRRGISDNQPWRRLDVEDEDVVDIVVEVASQCR